MVLATLPMDGDGATWYSVPICGGSTTRDRLMKIGLSGVTGEKLVFWTKNVREMAENSNKIENS